MHAQMLITNLSKMIIICLLRWFKWDLTFVCLDLIYAILDSCLSKVYFILSHSWIKRAIEWSGIVGKSCYWSSYFFKFWAPLRLFLHWLCKNDDASFYELHLLSFILCSSLQVFLRIFAWELLYRSQNECIFTYIF